MARILVIEDDDGLRALLHTVLDVYGYTVVEAANGVDGLRWYQAAPADLVITDLHLPGLEGLAVIRALQRACPGVTRAGRCWGLGCHRHLINLNVHVRVQALEDGTQLPVERLHARL